MRRSLLMGMVLGLFLGMACPFTAAASPRSTGEADRGKETTVEVRVISKGAKFVGTSMGGARVVIRDEGTGEVLACGITRGSTGATKRIMTASPRRGGVMATEDAASFRASLTLKEPRRIEVTARGPLAQPQSANSVSQTQWVVPGRDITGGDAWLLELRGLVVDVLQPPAHLKLEGTPRSVKLSANVTMMCGCPIAPGKPWKPEEFEVKAILMRNGERRKTMSLSYAGQPSQFEGTVELAEPGAYQATVYAYQPANGNTGLDHTTVVVSE